MANALMKSGKTSGAKKAEAASKPIANKPPVKNSSGPLPKKTESTTLAVAVSPKSAPLPDERRYAAEDAMRTLMRADEHRKDKGLMRDVAKMASDKMDLMKGLCGRGK